MKTEEEILNNLIYKIEYEYHIKLTNYSKKKLEEVTKEKYKKGINIDEYRMRFFWHPTKPKILKDQYMYVSFDEIQKYLIIFITN